MKRVLVTGAAGFLGSHLTETLLEQGVDVIGVDAFRPSYDPVRKRAQLASALAHPRFRLVELGLEDLEAKTAPDVDGVFHLAAQAGVRDSWGSEFAVYLRDNVLATERLLDAYRDRPLDFFVAASSSSVYGAAERLPTGEEELPQPRSPYGVTKLAAEQLALCYYSNFGLPALALRFFTVYGPRQRPDMAFSRFVEAHLEGRPLPVFGDGRQRRDFTFVEDCVTGILLAARKGRPGRVYNLGAGTPRGLDEVFAVLEKLSNRPVRLERRPAMPGDVPVTAADVRRAREELGFVPRVPLEEGLAAQWAWQSARQESGGAR